MSTKEIYEREIREMKEKHEKEIREMKGMYEKKLLYMKKTVEFYCKKIESLDPELSACNPFQKQFKDKTPEHIAAKRFKEGKFVGEFYFVRNEVVYSLVPPTRTVTSKIVNNEKIPLNSDDKKIMKLLTLNT